MRFHEFAVILEAPTEPSMLSKVGSWIGDKLGIHSAFTVTTPAASQGTDVADMQKALAALGYSRLLGAFGPKQDGVDGIVGEYTIRAVKRFQADNSIAPTGTTDAATIAALNKAIASKPELAGKLVKTSSSEIQGGQQQQPAGTPLQGGKKNPGAALQEPTFMPRLNQVASSLGIEPTVLLNVMRFESGLDSKAVNKMSNAVGLIQFMPNTASGLGTTSDQLFNMSATDQLDYVEKYYRSNGVKPGATVGDLYILTFMPAARNKPDNFVLGDKRGGTVFGLNKSAVYNQNKIFDRSGNGLFTVADVRDTINQRSA